MEKPFRPISYYFQTVNRIRQVGSLLYCMGKDAEAVLALHEDRTDFSMLESFLVYNKNEYIQCSNRISAL